MWEKRALPQSGYAEPRESRTKRYISHEFTPRESRAIHADDFWRVLESVVYGGTGTVWHGG